ncbi:MAG TPA: type II toxin-antitoxin system HicA family toxin [Candidatus Dormibacteraeota bacterium]|nr:type II toxin-antitoxin system HicA family toxin [Candidatus Dormibacteraeota bacterium]
MTKGPQVRRALEKAGWTEVRCRGSHHHFQKGELRATFSFHDSLDLGKSHLEVVAKAFGMTVDQLRDLL